MLQSYTCDDGYTFCVGEFVTVDGAELHVVEIFDDGGWMGADDNGDIREFFSEDIG